MQMQPNVKSIVYLAVFLSIPIAVLISFVRAKLLPLSTPQDPHVDLVLLMSTGVVAFLVSLVIAGVYRFLWRLWPTLFGVENLNGRWEGWYYRSLTNDICPTAHEILQQTPLTVSVQAFGWRDGLINKSSSRTAGFAQAAGTTTPTLIWPFQTKGRTDDPGGHHDGTHIMTLVRLGESRYLHGEYYNNRLHSDGKTRGAWGIIRLKYTKTKPMGHIGSIDEMGQPRAWAMPDVHENLLAIQRAMSEEISSVESRLEILKAAYWTSKARVDVTKELRKMIVGNKLKAIASNAIKGDPDFGTVKKLTIEYKYDGITVTKEFTENERMVIP